MWHGVQYTNDIMEGKEESCLRKNDAAKERYWQTYKVGVEQGKWWISDYHIAGMLFKEVKYK